MTLANIKWELSQIYKMKTELRIAGRDLEYKDEKRMDYLTEKLESYQEPNTTIMNPPFTGEGAINPEGSVVSNNPIFKPEACPF